MWPVDMYPADCRQVALSKTPMGHYGSLGESAVVGQYGHAHGGMHEGLVAGPHSAALSSLPSFQSERELYSMPNLSHLQHEQHLRASRGGYSHRIGAILG